MPELSPHQAVNEFFRQGAELVDLDDGGLLVTRGYGVQHNNARGPYKGGAQIRVSAAVKLRGYADA